MSYDRHLDSEDTREPRVFGPVHPGEILQDEFLKPMGISQNALARAIAVPPRRINEIVHGNRAVTADTALRLAKFFGMSAEFWLGLQADYELRRAEDQLRDRLDRDVHTMEEVLS
ncbi:MAG TPA: HigA family addiction module antitoxin [Rhodothermales bacterium]|nr:HigA family addiction module antitoxin [Rhodothermales bacterium]